MRGRLKLRTIAVGIAALWSMGSEGGCPFGQNAPPVATLSCASPTIMIEAGGSKPLDNPCSDQGDWARSGFLSDDFGFDFTGHPGITGIEIDKNFDATSALPPTRTLSVPSTVAPQTITLPFVYRFDDIGANPATFYNGKGELTLIITAPPGTLTAHADAMPATINSGEESLLLASANGEVCPPCSVRWFTAPSGNLVSDITNPHVTPTETTQYYFQITDSLGRQATSNTVTVTVRPPLAITTPSLPSGTVGVQYGNQLDASDTSGHLEWSVSGGTQPNGLNVKRLDTNAGFLTGTPTLAGTFNFTVQVYDSDTGRIGTHDYSVEIDNPVPGLTTLNPPSTPVGTSGLQLTIIGTGFVNGATVMFGTTGPLTPSSISSDLTQIVVPIPGGSLSQPGPVGVSVTNPPPGGGTSPSPLIFQITAPVIAGLVQTINVDPNVQPAGVTLGASGRFVAVLAVPTSLTGTWQRRNVFLQDTCLGTAGGCSPSTVLASAIDGSQPPREGNDDVLGSGFDSRVAMSDDGVVVGFSSFATNLVSPDTTQMPDTFLRYACPNVSLTCGPTVLASQTNAGTEPNDVSHLEALSPDGRYIVFRSLASNVLDSPVTPGAGGDLYLRDTCVAPGTRALIPGCTPRSVQVSQGTPDPNGVQTALAYGDTAVSAGGRFVVFNAVDQTGFPTSFFSQVFLHDTCGEPTAHIAGCTESTTLLQTPPFSTGSGSLSISADGRFVIFRSDGVIDVYGSLVYVLDTCRSTALVGQIAQCDPSAPAALTSIPMPIAPAPNPSSNARLMWTSNHSISADGRYVLFGVEQYNGVLFVGSVYVYDTCRTTTGPVPGCQTSTKMVSVDSQGNNIPMILGLSAVGDDMALSHDGHYAVFLYRVGPDAHGNYSNRAALAATGF